MESHLELLKRVYSKFGGVSTRMTDLIIAHQGIKEPIPFELTGYRLTTQTMVLELGGVKFNDFAIQAELLGNSIQQLMRRESQIIPSSLVSLSAKKFEVLLDHASKTVAVKKNFVSTTHEMNSSIDFRFKSLNQTARKEKVYQLRLFRNGMLQIPGVTDMYDLSEVRQVVNQLIALYKELFESVECVSVINRSVAMANFVTRINLPPNTVLDLPTVSFDVKRDKGVLFQSLCKGVGLDCVYFDLAVRRVVLYCKFAIPKERFHFTHYNPSSTSNRKEVRSITFQITQKGIVMIQGSDGNFQKTAQVIEAFQNLLALFIHPYIKPIPVI